MRVRRDLYSYPHSGDGVFAALLREAGFILMTEEELPSTGKVPVNDVLPCVIDV